MASSSPGGRVRIGRAGRHRTISVERPLAQRADCVKEGDHISAIDTTTRKVRIVSRSRWHRVQRPSSYSSVCLVERLTRHDHIAGPDPAGEGVGVVGRESGDRLAHPGVGVPGLRGMGAGVRVVVDHARADEIGPRAQAARLESGIDHHRTATTAPEEPQRLSMAPMSGAPQMLLPLKSWLGAPETPRPAPIAAEPVVRA